MALERRLRRRKNGRGINHSVHEMDLPMGKSVINNFLDGSYLDTEEDTGLQVKTIRQWRAVKDENGQPVRANGEQVMELAQPVRIEVWAPNRYPRLRQVVDDVETIAETKMEDVPDLPTRRVPRGLPNP